MNNITPPLNIETKNLSRENANKNKSLVPAVMVSMIALVLLLASFYIFLRIYNKYTLRCSLNADGVSYTIIAVEKRAVLPSVYFPSEIAFPEIVDGMPVTAISSEALDGFKNVKKVIIPETVTTLGKGTFASCSKLQSIKLPSSLGAIPENLFKDCIALETVVFGGNEKQICKSAFEGCLSLTSLTLPESVEVIDERAFSYCTGLTEIKLPSSLSAIGEEAFFGCESLAFLTVPHSVKEIGSYAFRGCSALEAINLGSVESIGMGAFHLCTSLNSITVPEKITFLDDKTFFGCGSLASVTLPRGLRGIGERVFENCEKLTEIKYSGTKNEWSNVGLDAYWSINSRINAVSCTDGKVDL